MKVKVVLNEETKVLEEVDDKTITLEELKRRCCDLFGVKTPLRLEVQDEDGDYISISTEQEFKHILTLQQSQHPLRVKIHEVKEEQQVNVVDLIPLMKTMISDPILSEMITKMVSQVLHTNAAVLSEAVQSVVSTIVSPDPTPAILPSQQQQPSASNPSPSDQQKKIEFEVIPLSGNETESEESASTTTSTTTSISTTPITQSPIPQIQAQQNQQQQQQIQNQQQQQQQPNQTKTVKTPPKPLAAAGALLSSLFSRQSPSQQQTNSQTTTNVGSNETAAQQKFDEQVIECENTLKELGFKIKSESVRELMKKFKKKELVIDALLQAQAKQQPQQQPPAAVTMGNSEQTFPQNK